MPSHDLPYYEFGIICQARETWLPKKIQKLRLIDVIKLQIKHKTTDWLVFVTYCLNSNSLKSI